MNIFRVHSDHSATPPPYLVCTISKLLFFATVIAISLISDKLFFIFAAAHADASVVTEGGSRAEFGFFVHQGETVTLPFRYQNFSMTACVAGAVADPAREMEKEVTAPIKVCMCKGLTVHCTCV